MKVSREFLKTIVNYKFVASRDQTRPFLCSVALRRKGNLVELTACNGYIAIRSMHVLVDVSDFEIDRYYIVPINYIDHIADLLKGYKHHDIFNLKIEGPFMYLGINESSDKHVNIQLLDREYPNIDSIYPKIRGHKVNCISINPDLVTQLRKAILGPLRVAIIPRFDFEFTANNGPMMATCKYKNIEHNIVMMPLKKGL